MKITTSDSSADGGELLYVCNKSYKIGYRDGKRDAEQKPAEWSEEDWQTLDEMREHLICVVGDKPDSTPNKIFENFINLIDKLKSIPLRCPKSTGNWKPSEEQIYSLGTVVKGYNECTIGSVGYNLKELYNNLKTLM